MFAVFDTKTNKIIFTDDSKSKVLEMFNTIIPDPDNRGELYDGYKIVKIETCVIDTDDELYDEIVDLDRTFYEWFLPRLVCFRKQVHNKKWEEQLDKVITTLQGLVNHELPYNEVDSARDMVRHWVGENLNRLWL